MRNGFTYEFERSLESDAKQGQHENKVELESVSGRTISVGGYASRNVPRFP
jgi:hypothetical protein